ncbi:MAG: hypothetical protein U1E50_07155 [Caulobacteraceae bacterium]
MAIGDENHLERHPEAEGAPVQYDPAKREYALVFRRDGDVVLLQTISHYPWCGEAFPPSLRGAWFEELERQGVDPMTDAVPERFKTDQWRRG